MGKVVLARKLRVCSGITEKRFSQITESEKKKAKSLYKKVMKSKKDEIKVKFTKNTNTQHIIDAIECLYFPYDLIYSSLYYTNLRGKVFKTIEYDVEMFKQLDLRNKKIEKQIKYIVETVLSVRNYEDEMDVVRRINDFLCQNDEYEEEKFDQAISPYEVLFHHRAICVGYATTFQMMCDWCGIKCDCISNETHVWNRVKIDGKWYHIDTCWNDCTSSDKYYMLSEKEMYGTEYANHPIYNAIDIDNWFMK